jgi:hypothetical protein
MTGDSRSGSGSITRGPGHAPLFAGTDTEALKAALGARQIKGGLNRLQPGELIAEKTEAPDANPDATAIRGKRRLFSTRKQDSTTEHRLLPRHRGVVKRYFSSKTEKK